MQLGSSVGAALAAQCAQTVLPSRIVFPVSVTSVQAPVVPPPQRPVFIPVPDEPPDIGEAARIFLAKLDGTRRQQEMPNIANGQFHVKSKVAFEGKTLFFQPRPLQKLSFGVRERLHHSLVMQIDGLLFACFRLRLERDVCALSSSVAYCTAFGVGASPASTFCGLYMPSQSTLGAVIRAVKLERGYGVFVGPSGDDAWPLLANAASPERSSELLVFTFVGPALCPWKGVFCSFAYQGKVKRKKRDVLFALEPIMEAHVPMVVPSMPFCPTRGSSHPHTPVTADDTAKRSAPLQPMPGVPRPLQVPVWNVDAMSKLALLFPQRDIAQMFELAIQSTGAPLRFVGDRSKRVVAANGTLEPEMVSQIRERFVAEAALGRMMGPFDRCPFPNSWNAHQARVTPLDTRKKDKYDASSKRFRVISNFSAGQRTSINSLIYSPKLISTHLQCSHLRDMLFSMGPKARFDAIDQQDAFRANAVNLDDAHLYCYQVGPEWFVDLRDPFGNVKSEYTFAIIVAILKWGFECDSELVPRGSYLLGYVDNWFLLSKADCTSHDSRWEALKTAFKRLGAPMHEEQRSRNGLVNALGWDWDLATGIFSCPDDKYQNCLKLTTNWARRAAADEIFTFNEIESLAGLFQWISTACPAIIASVASLQALKHALKKSGLQSRRLDDRSKTAIAALALFFKTWSRSCPLFSGFSPVAQWEVLIKVDASTDFGTGGFCIPFFECLIHPWSEDERLQALAHSATPIRESTTFFELLGILHLLRFFAPQLRGKRVQVECDNEAAIRDLTCCFSGKPLCMRVIADIRDICALNFIYPRFEHILSTFNNVADRLSHNDFTQARALCQQEFGQPLLGPTRQ